jgi:hypothetical protein
MKHQSLYHQQGKSVSFFDIDTVHYYNSDNCSESSSSDSDNDSSNNTTPKYKDIESHLTGIMHEKNKEQQTGAAYFRIDLPYRIPSDYMSLLQDTFNVDLDAVGDFFTDVYIYEVWPRKA